MGLVFSAQKNKNVALGLKKLNPALVIIDMRHVIIIIIIIAFV